MNREQSSILSTLKGGKLAQWNPWFVKLCLVKRYVGQLLTPLYRCEQCKKYLNVEKPAMYAQKLKFILLLNIATLKHCQGTVTV